MQHNVAYFGAQLTSSPPGGSYAYAYAYAYACKNGSYLKRKENRVEISEKLKKCAQSAYASIFMLLGTFALAPLRL